jgi:hypothetical protein
LVKLINAQNRIVHPYNSSGSKSIASIINFPLLGCRIIYNRKQVIISTCDLCRYKIPYIASDETYSLEFMFFEKKGTELIGKSAETLRKKYNEKDIPPEISSWIGHKFIFLVKILPNKSIGADDPSFEVIRIKEKLGKQSIMPVSKTGKSKPVISTLAYEGIEENLPLLIPITSKKIDGQVYYYSLHVFSFLGVILHSYTIHSRKLQILK